MPFNSSRSKIECLNEVEGGSPEAVITSFFDSYHLSDAKKELGDILRIVVDAKYKGTRLTIEEDDMRLFFEKLEGLVEAAWRVRG